MSALTMLTQEPVERESIRKHAAKSADSDAAVDDLEVSKTNDSDLSSDEDEHAGTDGEDIDSEDLDDEFIEGVEGSGSRALVQQDDYVGLGSM
ncbi:MAG: hypothetical protein Q9166_001739 [cf. Caloplaca sp. 2 TL-2023]